MSATLDSVQRVLIRHDSLLVTLRDRLDSLAAAATETVRDTLWAGF